MEVPVCGDILENRYRLDELLGEGGSAIVYRAWDASSMRKVAIKLFKPGPEGYAPVTIRRFEREVRIIANLTDPHTVTLYDSGRTHGFLYMVFEFVDGVDLAELLGRHGTLAPREVTHILIQVLSSLREAHTHGLLHRDIKPENVRVHETREDPMAVKLLDFGIARSSGEHNASITKTGELVGTPRYMSPEALMEQPMSPASDVYSVGVLAMEMLFGRNAIHGNRWDDQFDRLVTGHVFSFPEIDRVPRELRIVLDRMVGQRPEDRYQSAGAVISALRQIEFEDDNATLDVQGTNNTTDHQHLDARTLIESPTTAFAPSPMNTMEMLAVATQPAVTLRSVAIAAVVVFAITLFVGYQIMAPPTAKPETTPAPPVELPSAVVSVAPAEHPMVFDPDNEPIEVTGCGESAFVEGQHEAHAQVGMDRSRWVVRTPANYDPAVKHPVLVLFHHDKSSPEEIIAQTNIAEAADRDGIIVIAPFAGAELAWRDPVETDVVPIAVRQTAQSYCVDSSRIYLLGHGGGSHAVETLSCEPWVTAVATASYLPRRKNFSCAPTQPVSSIHIAPLDTPHVPVDGGRGCSITPGASGVSLATFDRRWAARNRARGNPAFRKVGDDVCYRYVGERVYESCHVHGGFGWPGTSKRSIALDPRNCDGFPPKFPSLDVITEFFREAPALQFDEPEAQ